MNDEGMTVTLSWRGIPKDVWAGGRKYSWVGQASKSADLCGYCGAEFAVRLGIEKPEAVVR